MDEPALTEQPEKPDEASRSGTGGHSPEAEDAPVRAAPPLSRGLRLAKLAGTHMLVFMLVLSMFAAADSWSRVSGLWIAGLLCVLTGALAGLTVTTLIHEWFHYLGARFSGARYDIPQKQGLFLYDWDFSSNNLKQFWMMSTAGSVGGALALIWLWNAIPADSWGRAALQGGAIASFVFAAYIEWPVLKRVRVTNDPLSEMSKIDERVLTRSFITALVVGILTMVVLAP